MNETRNESITPFLRGNKMGTLINFGEVYRLASLLNFNVEHARERKTEGREEGKSDIRKQREGGRGGAGQEWWIKQRRSPEKREGGREEKEGKRSGRRRKKTGERE